MNKLFQSILLLVMLVLILPQRSAAQQGNTFSLQEAVNYARKNNLSLRNSELDVKSMEKKVNEVFASGLPQVNASANLISNIEIAAMVLPNFLKPVLGSGPDYIQAKFGNRYTSNITLSANQLLFDGTFILGLKASREFVNLMRLNANRTTIETETGVSKAYYLVLMLDANEAMMQKNVETLTKARNDIEQIHRNGFAERIDLDRMNLQLSNLQIASEKISDQKRLARMVLKLQMGYPMADTIILNDNLEKLYKESKNLVPAQTSAYQNRVEYQMLNQQLRINRLDHKRYLVGYMPTFVAFANIQRNAFAGEGQFNNLYNTLYPGTAIGLSMSLPVFDGFRKHAQAQQATISIAKTENDLKNFEKVMDQQVFMAKTTFVRSGEQLEVLKRNLQLAQDIYERTELKYKNGVGSSLEWTTAQSDLETARTNYLNGMYEYFVAELELRKALGQIN